MLASFVLTKELTNRSAMLPTDLCSVWTIIFSSLCIWVLLALGFFLCATHCFDPTSAVNVTFFSQSPSCYLQKTHGPWFFVWLMFCKITLTFSFCIFFFFFFCRGGKTSPPCPCITRVTSWLGPELKLDSSLGRHPTSHHPSGDTEVQLPGVLRLSHSIPHLLCSPSHDSTVTVPYLLP